MVFAFYSGGFDDERHFLDAFETTDGLFMDAFSKVAPAGTVVRCVPQLVPSLRPGHALCVDAAVTMLILP